MQHLISGFTDYLQYEKRYSIHTVQAYQNDLEQFFLFIRSQFEHTDIKTISHIHIRSWLAQLKEIETGSRSINRKISTLKSFYRFLLKKEFVVENPMGKIISPKNSKRLPVFVNENNMANLMEQPLFSDDFKGKTDKLILELLYQTGMRRAELLGLQLVNVDASNKTVKVLGKGNKERLIPIQTELCNLLQEYIQARSTVESLTHSNLLTFENGKPLYEKYIYNTHRKKVPFAHHNPR
jgi:integrase/recombinase XerC